MRYLFLLMLPGFVLLAGVASVFWLVPVTTELAIGLGGSPAHQLQALVFGAIGLLLGMSLRRRNSLALLLSLAFAALPAVIGIGTGALPFHSPILLLTLVTLLAIPAGYTIGPGEANHGAFPPLTAFGTALGFFGSIFLIDTAGTRAPILVSVGFGAVLVFLKIRGIGRNVECSAPPSPRVGARQFPVLLALAFWSGGIWLVTTRPLVSIWPTSPLALWSLLGVQLLGTLPGLFGASVLKQRHLSLRLETCVACLAASAAALTLFLAFLPRWGVVLGGLSGQGSPSIPLALLLLAEVVLLYSPSGFVAARVMPSKGWPVFIGAGALGVLAANQFLVPWLSTEGLLRLMAFVIAGASAFALLGSMYRPLNRSFLRVGLVCLMAGLSTLPLFVPPWNPADLVRGGGADTSPKAAPASSAGTELFFQGEDEHGTLLVKGIETKPELRFSGFPMTGSNTVEEETFLGHLPMMLHSAPERVLVVGSGLGVAIDSVRAHQPTRISWLNFSRLRAGAVGVFHTLNHDVLVDPRLIVEIGALRPFSSTHKKQFDVVVVLAPPLETLERESRYSQEGLAAIEQLLAPEGIAAISLPVDGNPEWLMRSLSTFRQVFPQGLVWRSPGSPRQLVLTGSPGPTKVSIANLEREFGLRNVRDQLASADIRSALDVLASLLIVPSGLAQASALQLTDRGHWPPYSAKGESPVLSLLLPMLQPLMEVVDTRGASQPLAELQAQLDKILQYHRSYVSMLANLEEGVFTGAVEEARNLLRTGTGKGDELDAFVQPYLKRAEAYHQSHQLDKAIEQLSVVRIIHPGLVDAPLALARIYEEKGLNSQAIKQYQEALRLKPESIQAQTGLANLLRQEGRFTEAIVLLEAVATRVPASATLYHNLGTLHLAIGELPRAKDLFEQAIQLDRRFQAPHAGLAEVFFRQGRYDAAVTEAELAVRLEATPYALNLLGQAALRKGATEVARNAFVRCLLIDPDHIEARGGLGILAAEAGDIDRAREQWEQVLQMDPENHAARENLSRLNAEFPPRRSRKEE